ncbi:hypothetical protein ABFS82_03G036500 [Erythranthe guttata]
MSKISFHMLLRIIQPQINKDKSVQVRGLALRLEKHEISRDVFLHSLRSIVGEHLLNSALYKGDSNELQSLPQASVQQMSPTQIKTDLIRSDEVENQADLLQVQELVDLTNEKHNKAEISSAQTLFPSSSAQIRQGYEAPGNNLKDEYSSMQSSEMGLMPPPMPVATSVSSKSLMHSLTSSIEPETSSKAIPKKTSVGKKKTSVGKKKSTKERVVSSPPSSKKQKLSCGAFPSIKELNDVTALSGIDIREEEEHLFSSPKKGSRVSETSLLIVQEEENMILHKIPLQKKLMETIAKRGLTKISNDVERCLSLCVEERMRGLIYNLIKVSKKRMDTEKTSQRTVITSDVKQQIMSINRKADEEQERKEAETQTSEKLNLPEGTTGVDGDKKRESCARLAKAANMAVRAATGTTDMMSRWQSMIEAKQKQQGIDKSGKDVINISNQDGSEVSGTPALDRKIGQIEVMVPQVRRCSITVKDVIAVLERDPQLSKSTLIYKLYLFYT